jgi:hypothetical protein
VAAALSIAAQFGCYVYLFSYLYNYNNGLHILPQETTFKISDEITT